MSALQKEDFKTKQKLVQGMYDEVINLLKAKEVDLSFSQASDFKWYTVTLPCVDSSDYSSLARLMIFQLTKDVPLGEVKRTLYINRKQYSTEIEDASQREKIYHKFIMRACWIWTTYQNHIMMGSIKQ